jgi:hypothetical protein
MRNEGSRFAKVFAIVAAGFAVAVGACGAEPPNEEIAAVQSALDPCVFGAPVVTETRQETPGGVAPGISKIYFVTVRNGNSATCGPATLSFVPDSFHLFSIVAQPSSAGGVASGATAQFRVTVTSDPSVAPGTYTIGFTVVSLPGGTSVRGALTYVATLDNPVGCNRQPPAFSIDNDQPPPVPPPGSPVSYRITVRNVDNRECGPDSFSVLPFSLHLLSAVADGPFTIAPQASAVFTLTITPEVAFTSLDLTEGFTLLGQRHLGNLVVTGSVRYRIQ